MVLTVRLSDRAASLLDGLAERLECLLGRRPTYEELIEMLLDKLESLGSLPEGVWY